MQKRVTVFIGNIDIDVNLVGKIWGNKMLKKTKIHCFVILGLGILLVFFVREFMLYGSENSPEDNTGVNLFINACRIQEDNFTMYHSASFECETAEFPYNDDFFKEKILISGNFPEKTLIRTERVFHASSPYYRGVGEATVILRKEGIDIGVTSVTWEPGSQQSRIDEFLYTVPWAYSFGRIRGNHVQAETSLLALFPKSKNRYDFSQEAIDFFYVHVAGYKRVLGISLYQHVRDENYDDGRAVAKVVECRTENNVLFQEYWIDPSRGYVCPIVRIFDKTSGKIREEYIASDFFQDRVSGLWFPAYYEETRFNGIDDTVTHKIIHKIDPSTFQLNRKIADEEFSVDIPEGALVIDRRNESSIRVFQASQNGALSLAEGGLDFAKMNWLDDLTPLSPEEIDILMQNNSIGVGRIILIIIGVIIILLALFGNALKRAKTGLVLIAALGLSGGCSQPVNSDVLPVDLVVIDPEVVDLGNIRPTLEPMVFDVVLRNNGESPLTILDVFADCGCTVLDKPSQPVLPQEEMQLPVKVSLYGRFGDFSHTIRMTTDGTPESVVLTIKGKAVTDIWPSGQSIRCTAEAGLPASSIVELHTVDYPDVQFDLSKAGEDMIVKELSRATKDDITTIRFSLDVDMGGNDFRMRELTFVPVGNDITPITIPVYCYRLEETTSVSKIHTQAINLGMVDSDETCEVPIHGDLDLISVINQAVFNGFPENVVVTILPHRESNEAILLNMQFPPMKERDSIKGHIKLVTEDNKKIQIPVSGVVRNNPPPIGASLL